MTSPDDLWWLVPPAILLAIGVAVVRDPTTGTARGRRAILSGPRKTAASLVHGEVTFVRGRVVAENARPTAFTGRDAVWEIHTVEHVPSATGRSTRKVAYTKSRSSPFRLDDGSGAPLTVDPAKATMYVDPDLVGECGASAPSLPDRLAKFLAQHAIREVTRMWFHEWSIGPGDEVVVLGTAVIDEDGRSMKPLPAPDGSLVVAKLDVETLARRFGSERRAGWILVALGLILMGLALVHVLRT
jgi:hypothetical protein